MKVSARGRAFLALLIGVSMLVVLVAMLQRRCGYYRPGTDTGRPGPTSSPPNTASPFSQPSLRPAPGSPPVSTLSEPSPTTSPANVPNPPASPPGFVGRLKLIVPVVGVQPHQLLDTYADSRSDGRVHDALDIPAAQGTPVVATADGQVIRLFQSELGGITIYQLSGDKKLIFYYAHLQRYADGLTESKFVRQGEVIGYVGDTGNPGPGNYHLHFSIAVVSDPTRYWEGSNINPYPLLRK